MIHHLKALACSNTSTIVSVGRQSICRNAAKLALPSEQVYKEQSNLQVPFTSSYNTGT